MKDDLELIISAVRYIEANLKEKLSLEEIARQVGFSKYYFTRLFAKYTGQSPYDYYRGRKLTETIHYMEQRRCKIIDAAFEYGFSSPEVFARACTSTFGRSPSAIRKQIVDGTFNGIQPISEGYLWFANSHTIEPMLQIIESIDLMGIGFFTEHYNESLYNMPLAQLRSISHPGEEQLFKITWLDKQAMGYMNFIGRRSSEATVAEAMLIKSLPKMAYLVFDYRLPLEDLAYFYQYIYEDYIPDSPYELLTPFHMEVYTIEGSQKVSQLYIPVIP